jgi:hypothetical protein
MGEVPFDGGQVLQSHVSLRPGFPSEPRLNPGNARRADRRKVSRRCHGISVPDVLPILLRRGFDKGQAARATGGLKEKQEEQ